MVNSGIHEEIGLFNNNTGGTREDLNNNFTAVLSNNAQQAILNDHEQSNLYIF